MVKTGWTSWSFLEKSSIRKTHLLSKSQEWWQAKMIKRELLGPPKLQWVPLLGLPGSAKLLHYWDEQLHDVQFLWIMFCFFEWPWTPLGFVQCDAPRHSAGNRFEPKKWYGHATNCWAWHSFTYIQINEYTYTLRFHHHQNNVWSFLVDSTPELSQLVVAVRTIKNSGTGGIPGSMSCLHHRNDRGICIAEGRPSVTAGFSRLVGDPVGSDASNLVLDRYNQVCGG